MLDRTSPGRIRLCVDARSCGLAKGPRFGESHANPVETAAKIVRPFGNSNGIGQGPLAFQSGKLLSTRLERRRAPLRVDGVEIVSVGLIAEPLSLELLALQISTYVK